MKKITGAIKRIKSSGPAACFTAVLGAVAYLGQSAIYIFQLPSTLDEGNYLYKGYLFATGVLTPYQDYGVWTNKMPFAFIIPGWVQAIFEPGIRTGRYFAVFLGLLLLLGLWIVARRLGGKWWAAGAVLAIALNPGLVRMLVQALSEGLVVSQLIWVLVILMVERPSLWRTITGAALAAVVFLTRENMVPVMLFAFIFIWWQHGRKHALIGAGVMAVVIIAVHAIFWPNILTIWAPRIPESISPFLDPFRAYTGTGGIWSPDPNFMTRLYAFWEGMRYHFVPIAGTVFVVLLWPSKDKWKNSFQFRSAVILLAMMIVLTLMHMWASLFESYCTFCFPLYMAFFSPIGLLVVVSVAPLISIRLPAWRDIPALLLVPILGAGMGFGAHQDLDEILLNIRVPRIRGMQLQEGFTELWRMLANKFDFTYDQLKQIIPTSFGLIAGIIIVLAALIVILVRLRHGDRRYSLGALALTICLAAGAILTPSKIFGNIDEKDCGGDVIASYEKAAPILRASVPPGSLVFWEGGLVTVPLLYLPDIQIFGPQLNDGYSFRKGGDADTLYKFGYWNAELSDRWMDTADILLIEDRAYQRGYNQVISLDKFEQIEQTPVLFTCRELSTIRVFRRIP